MLRHCGPETHVHYGMHASYYHTLTHGEEKIGNDGYSFYFFILMEPFLTLPLSLLYLSENPLKGPLEIVCLWTIILILICAIVQSRFGLLQKSIYGLGFVLGCSVITASFLMSAFPLKGNRTVKWRDRSYLIGTKQHPFHL